MPIWVEIIADLFDSFLGAFFVWRINRDRTVGKHVFLLSFFLCTALTIGFSFVSSFSMVMTVLYAGILFIQSLQYKASALTTRLLAPIVFMIILILTSTFSSYFWAVLGKCRLDTVLLYGQVERYLMLVTHKLLMALFCFLTDRFFVREERFRISHLLLFLLMPLFTIAALYLLVAADIGEGRGEVYGIVLLLITALSVSNLISVIVFLKSSENARLEYEVAVLKNQIACEESKYAEIRILYEKLRAARHDFKEQLAYIRKLNGEGNSTVAEYLSEIEKNTVLPERFIQTDNRTVDYVLCSKAEEHSDVTFLVTGTLADIKSLSALELASLFGNIVQNAIDAVEKAENPEDKKIEIRFSVQGDYQNITCINAIKSSVLEKNPNLVTTKADTEKHGFGIRSIRSTVERVNGLLEFYEENGKFYTHCAIPVTKENNNP